MCFESVTPSPNTFGPPPNSEFWFLQEFSVFQRLGTRYKEKPYEKANHRY